MPRTLLNESTIPSKYKSIEHTRRRAVLKDTIGKFLFPGALDKFTQQAQKNHQQWQAAEGPLPKRVRVISGDWGDVTLKLSQQTGNTYAVLNMANAYSPGGGYLEGMVAQEENMYRRTNCHFYVHDQEMDKAKRHYIPEMTQLINGRHGEVYLDTKHPRICIKGKEHTKATGYEDLDPKSYFLFYELKAAADDLRGGIAFNEQSMRNKIVAQLNTLKKQKIRHVVLSAFGCGAFGNPADKVARIYQEELAMRGEDFDDVVFAIFHAGYGPDNFQPFAQVLDGLPLYTEQPLDHKPLLSTIKDCVNQPIWDKRGYAFIFFDFRKTPTGIAQIRQIINSAEGDDVNKITQLKQVAQNRLKNPPQFTKRDEQVMALYQNIMKIDLGNANEELITLFAGEKKALMRYKV